MAGLFRSVLRVAAPFVAKTGKSLLRAAGTQALTSGAALAGDLMAGRSFKTALRERAREGAAGVMRETKKAVLGSPGNPPGMLPVKRKRNGGGGASPVKRKRGGGSKRRKTTKARRKDIFS